MRMTIYVRLANHDDDKDAQEGWIGCDEGGYWCGTTTSV